MVAPLLCRFLKGLRGTAVEVEQKGPNHRSAGHFHGVRKRQGSRSLWATYATLLPPHPHVSTFPCCAPIPQGHGQEA